MGVELRVVLPRRGLLEHRHGEPGRVGELAPAAVPHPGRAPVGLEVRERGLDGDVVGVEHALVAGQAPPQRHGLGGGEGGVVAGDGADELAVLGDLVPERVPETDTGGRVEARQQILELLLADRPRQPEAIGLPARPEAGDLVAVLRVEIARIAGVIPSGLPCPGGVDRRPRRRRRRRSFSHAARDTSRWRSRSASRPPVRHLSVVLLGSGLHRVPVGSQAWSRRVSWVGSTLGSSVGVLGVRRVGLYVVRVSGSRWRR